jgi:NAD(P)H-nitrite reductase large subunit
VDPNREICICFHVSARKVVNFIRLEKPQRASQLSECFGAGTGCGWCRPYLEQLFAAVSEGHPNVHLPTHDEYADGRSQHIHDGKGVPPPGDESRADDES